MSFGWADFLNARGVPYRDSGPNTSAGNLVIKCPFCGAADEGEHMSIALSGAGWRCFRRPMDHRGRSPVRLIAALLRCTSAEAARIAGVRDLPASLADSVRARLTLRVDNTKMHPAPLDWPKDIQPLTQRVTALPYLSYLANRLDTSQDDAARIAHGLDLRWASSGPYAGRVIFPVRAGGKLMTWTGRTISRAAGAPRYKTLSTDPEKAGAEGSPPALAPTSDLLLFYDYISARRQGRALAICEGPFDALKLRVLGGHLGLNATCLFGLNLSPAQAALLAGVAANYERAFLLLDRGALAPALRMRGLLAQIGVGLRHLPPGVKDPGALTRRHSDFLSGLLTLK